MSRHTLAPAVAAAVVVAILLSSLAFAHNVQWSVPGFGSWYWGYGCHSDSQWNIPPPDYSFCAGAQVEQDAAGTPLKWDELSGSQGQCSSNCPAWWGEWQIWDGNGSTLKTSGGPICVQIGTNWTSIFATVSGPSTYGTYYQQSGAGDVTCLGSYNAPPDYLMVVGQ